MCLGKIVKCLFGVGVELGDMNAVWKRDFDRDRHSHPTLLSLSMLTSHVLLKRWFLLHSGTAHCNQICSTACSCTSHFLTRNTLKFCQAGRGEVEDAGLSNWSSCRADNQSGRPSYSTPSPPFLVPFSVETIEQLQDRDNRQIPTHTVESKKEVHKNVFLFLLLLLWQRSDEVTNKVGLQASKVTQSEIIFLVDCSRSVR